MSIASTLSHFSSMAHVAHTSVFVWTNLLCISTQTLISPPKLSLNYQNQTRAFQHFTSYSLLLDFTTLNYFLNDIAQSFTASFTASMLGYFAPCTTLFSLYSYSLLLISCITGFPKPLSRHSPSNG